MQGMQKCGWLAWAGQAQPQLQGTIARSATPTSAPQIMGTQQRTSPRKRGEQRDHRIQPEAPLPMSQRAPNLKRKIGRKGKGATHACQQQLARNTKAKAKKKANAKRDLGGCFTRKLLKDALGSTLGTLWVGDLPRHVKRKVLAAARNERFQTFLKAKLGTKVGAGLDIWLVCHVKCKMSESGETSMLKRVQDDLRFQQAAQQRPLTLCFVKAALAFTHAEHSRGGLRNASRRC